MFGPAGSGKSAFANTIAHRLDVGNDVALIFYSCERGDSILSSSTKLLATIAYRIACKHEEYRNRLLEVLSKNDGIPTAFHDIHEQYQLLLGNLLPNVTPPTHPFALVVDGFVARSDRPGYGKLAVCMLKLAKAIPWVKLVITSRPEQYLLELLSKDRACAIFYISEEEETDADIRFFIRAQLERFKLETHFDKVDDLVHLARGQFFLCRSIFEYLQTSRNLRRDLEKLLTEMAGQTEEEQLYHLYDCILDHAAQNDKYTQHVVLGIIYVSSANRPLSAEAISSFLQHDRHIVYEDPHSILSLTQKLHAVLSEQTNPRVPLRVRHPSFLSYLRKKLDDGVFVKLSEIHELMATGCLKTLHRELRFNICSLEDSYRLNKDVPDLSKRIQEHICEVLQYSSLFWFDHVSQCDLTRLIHSVSAFIMSRNVLYWLEVLSLLNASDDAVTIIKRGCVFFKVRWLNRV